MRDVVSSNGESRLAVVCQRVKSLDETQFSQERAAAFSAIKVCNLHRGKILRASFPEGGGIQEGEEDVTPLITVHTTHVCVVVVVPSADYITTGPEGNANFENDMARLTSPI